MLGRGAMLGLFFGALGAAGWAAVSEATGMRLGFLAILVGGLAGFGMGVGNKARGGMSAGFVTAIVAMVSILGSRYVVMHWSVQDFLRSGAEITPEDALYEVAGDVQQEFAADGVEFDDGMLEGEYPPVVVEEAERRWSALTPDQQQEYMTALSAHYAEQGKHVAGFMTFVALLVDFGLFGFVWLGLGVATAYQIGATRGQGQAGTSAGADESTEGFWARAAPSADPNAVIEQQIESERTAGVGQERAAA